MPLPLPHLLLPGMMMTRMRLRTRTLRGLSRLLPRVLFVKVLITLAHLALREITVVVRVVMALVLTLKMMTLYISIIEVVIKDSWVIGSYGLPWVLTGPTRPLLTAVFLTAIGFLAHLAV